METPCENQPSPSFGRDALERIQAETFVAQVEFHRQLGSTNDRGLELAGRDACRFPLLVLAESQTAGRGRGPNRWWACRGALTFSVLLETEAAQLPPSQWPQASLTAGLAVCEAVEDLLTEDDIGLKWPNDVYLRNRKVCGILVEVPRDRKGVLVIGIGINVNNSLKAAPADLASTATSLSEAAGRQLALSDVLVRVLQRISQRFCWIGSRDDELRQRWRDRCLLTNRTVHLDLGPRRVVGLCQGIDDEGALVVRTADGPERCFAGVVTQFS